MSKNPLGGNYHAVSVVYKGYDHELDKRIERAFRGTGVSPGGAGFGFTSNERDIGFYSSRPLSAEKLKLCKAAARRVARWTRIVEIEVERVRKWNYDGVEYSYRA